MLDIIVEFKGAGQAGWLSVRHGTKEDFKCKVTCRVRSLSNGLRKVEEVVRSIPGGKPYDPVMFPSGSWDIVAVEHIPYSATYGSVKIRTNAEQKVKVWSLDGDGDYAAETNEEVVDKGYLLHYSESSTTLGCIRLPSMQEAEELAILCEEELGRGNKGSVHLGVLYGL